MPTGRLNNEQLSAVYRAAEAFAVQHGWTYDLDDELEIVHFYWYDKFGDEVPMPKASYTDILRSMCGAGC